MVTSTSRPTLSRPGAPASLDIASLGAAFNGVVGYTMVVLAFVRDGIAVPTDALVTLRDFIADHAEEAIADVRRAEARIGTHAPALAVTEERALRSTGEFLLAARCWLDEAVESGEVVRRREVDLDAEPILADAVLFARRSRRLG